MLRHNYAKNATANLSHANTINYVFRHLNLISNSLGPLYFLNNQIIPTHIKYIYIPIYNEIIYLFSPFLVVPRKKLSTLHH